MKRTILILTLFLSALSLDACDLCGLYSSVMPRYNSNYIGLRLRARSFQGETPHQHHMEIPAPEEHEHYHENYFSTDLMGRYFINSKLSISAFLPYSISMIEREEKTETFSGMGDPSLLLHYRVIESSTEKWKHIVTAGAGVKFPLGKYDRTLSNGDYEIHSQTGTGSMDYLANANYLGRAGKNGISADAMFRYNTANPEGYRIGHRLNLSVNAFRWVELKRLQLVPQAGLYGEYSPEDSEHGIELHDSGGKALFGNAGLDIFFRNLSFSNNIQVPLAQEPGAGMPLNKLRVISALTWYL